MIGRVRPATWVRVAAVAVITASVTLAAACSDEDVVDTIPPPRPNRTTTLDGPQGVPRVTATTPTSPSSTVIPTSTTTGRKSGTTSGVRATSSTAP